MDSFAQRLGKPPESSKVSEKARSISSELDAIGRPSKKQRLSEDEKSDYDSQNRGSDEEDVEPRSPSNRDRGFLEDEEDEPSATPFESSMPDTKTDKEAVDEYEAMRAAEAKPEEQARSRVESRMWIKGRSSIYVDAFNLALDTVLEDESHLFDRREREVFEQWRDLKYEAQYLYVRLFLRKTASWHRANRLGYYDDISDPEAAVRTLQEVRPLPDIPESSQPEPIPGVELKEFSLGEIFTFADASEDYITTVEEAVSLLGLDELKALAKEAKLQGKNKADLAKALCRMSHQQTGLMSMGVRRSGSGNSTPRRAVDQIDGDEASVASLNRQDSNREKHFLDKILALTGPCIRLSPLTFKLFERVHLVFYRSTQWTEKSLTTIILAKISRRNFPEYIVCRTNNIFASRTHLLEFEAAIRVESEVDKVLEFGDPPGEKGFDKVVGIFENIYPRWKMLVAEEQVKEDTIYESGEGAYLRRFTATHTYTRIVHKAAFVFGRLKEYQREHDITSELLDQTLFHTARRGGWYQRKALLEEHYMHAIDPTPVSTEVDQQKKHWKRKAVATCEAGLQDNNCHLIYHYDLQRRLVKLEKQLRIPRRLQHDFGHVRLHEPIEHTALGIQLKNEDPVAKPGKNSNTKTIWVDELEGGGECSVEEMCLSWYRSQGWKGYHSEGGIVRTLFAYLFYDILFLYIPNVFQTAYQTCPLDLLTDAFYPARASEINHRLAEISNGDAERILRGVDAAHRERRTSVIGLIWDFELEDLVELVNCFDGGALAAVCKVMAQEYRLRGGGIPDLILWRTDTRECMFSEVKSASDRLSDTQRLWIHVLSGAGVKVALCNAVAREVRIVD